MNYKVLIKSEDIYYAWNELGGWLELGDISTEEDFISYGMDTDLLSLIPEEDWRQMSSPSIVYYTNNPDVEKVIIETETEPFTLYDEMGDSMEVLYYTDDPEIEEAELHIEANYSPLDEFDDFSIVTWTDDTSKEDLHLHMKALPHGQLVFQEDDFKASLIEGLSIEAIDVTMLVSTDQGNAWKTFHEDSWITIEPTKENAKAYGMTPEVINNLTEDELLALIDGKEHLRFAYYLEQEDYDHDVLVDAVKIKNKNVPTETPILKDITIDYDELTIEGRLKKLEETNAVNLKKLNFKSNALMQSEKYKMYDLVIDTFEADSMNNREGSVIYEEDLKIYKGKGVIFTEQEKISTYASNLMITAEYNNCLFEYSLNNGATWHNAQLDEIIDISDKDGHELVIRITLSNEKSELTALAVGWA